MTSTHALRLAAAATLGLSACAGAPVQRTPPPPARLPQTQSVAVAPDTPAVSATILPGQPTAAARRNPAPTMRPGDISLNYPSVDVRDLTQVILGDLLHKPFHIETGLSGSVSLVTAHPISRDSVLTAFEDALRQGKFALTKSGGTYVVSRADTALGSAVEVTPDEAGFGFETAQLKFVSPAEVKRIVDAILPSTIEVVDAPRGLIKITGAMGQRRAAHDLIEQFDVDWLKGMSLGLFVPQHTDSRLIVPELEKVLNGPGAPSAGLVRLVAMERLNGILAVSGQPQYLDDVRRWIEVLDREGNSTERRLYVYRAQNSRSADLAKVLLAALGLSVPGQPGSQSALSRGLSGDGLDAPNTPVDRPANAAAGSSPPPRPNGGLITSDDSNNAVLVYATPREYAIIEDGLRKLDVAPTQVLIEAAITEVQLNHKLSYGVQWQFANSNGGKIGLAQGSALPTGQVFPGFSYFYTNGGSITAALNALSGLTHIDVLSAPKLLVLNNHTATLQVGDQVPVVVASSVSTVGSNAPVVNSVEYRDTGVILKITPRVNSGGLVLLDVTQEVSDVITTDTSTINSPTIQQRRFTTSIAIQDGQTIALGGLIRDTKTKTRGGLPVLSALPGVGALAGSRSNTDDRTELLILLTPRVVRSSADAQSVADELRRKISQVRPLRSISAFRP